MRPFETDYAGWWRGHCKTLESAIVAATRKVVYDGFSRCTITNKETGQIVARVELQAHRKSATITMVKALPKRTS